MLASIINYWKYLETVQSGLQALAHSLWWGHCSGFNVQSTIIKDHKWPDWKGSLTSKERVTRSSYYRAHTILPYWEGRKGSWLSLCSFWVPWVIETNSTLENGCSHCPEDLAGAPKVNFPSMHVETLRKLSEVTLCWGYPKSSSQSFLNVRRAQTILEGKTIVRSQECNSKDPLWIALDKN